MRNNIEMEKEESEKYDFVFIPDSEKKVNRKLVELSKRNVAIVEAMIRNDSAYNKSADINKGPSKTYSGKNYSGSTGYWMTELKKYLAKEKTQNKNKYEEIIKNAVIAVDRDNRTHLNSDNVGREEISKRIIAFQPDELKEYLKDPVKTDFKLIKKISEKTQATKGRENISFASKFCHYASFYLFEGKPEQDNYSIYDNVLLKILPDYIKYYDLNEKLEKKDYENYWKIIVKIRESAAKKAKQNKPISRNGFDHLLWYYYKGKL